MHSKNSVALASPANFILILRIFYNLQQEANEVETKKKSNLLNILKFARDEWFLLLFASFFAVLKGSMFPIFSIIYGAMFLVSNQR